MSEVGLKRRSLLAQLGLASVGFALAGDSAIAATTEPRIPAGRATFTPRGGFDLSNPAHLKRARLKVLNSLDGRTTYFYTITRHILCPPSGEPYPLHAEMELTSIGLERTTDMTEDEAKVRAVFTRAPLDPYTFKVISEYQNPYVGRTLPVKDTLFAGGGRAVSLDADTPANPILQSDEPHYRIGDDIAFIMFDPRTGEGEFQPRIDTVVWRTNYAALMDAQTLTVDADYTFSAVLRASAYAWSGIEEGDPAQMLTMKTGRKVSSVAALPIEVREALVAKYPERV